MEELQLAPDPLVISIQEMVSGISHQPLEASIFRVPKRIRDTNEKAYTPQTISIGPLHRGQQSLQPKEGLKRSYLEKFLSSSGVLLETLVEMVKGWEERARSYYGERIELSSDEFVTMMLVDGCFIVEALLSSESQVYPVMLDIAQDMILIENQLPFFVLEGLFKVSGLSTRDLLRYVIRFFGHRYLLVLGSQVDIRKLCQKVNDFTRDTHSEVRHLVDLLRICYLPSSLRLPQGNNNQSKSAVSSPNATGLHEAGVSFRTCPTNNLLDIRFNKAKGILEIPKLHVYDATELLLRNVAILEQYCYIFDSYVLDYLFFMHSLVNTAKDVDLLVQSEILDMWAHNSSSAANLFTKMSENITMCGPNYYYSAISEDLAAYCKVPRHSWRATLVRDYLRTPWRIASTIAAVILLVLTLIQTVCSIISVV